MNQTPSSKKTMWIALTAIFTALTTVATVVLYIALPAGGYFNLSEAVIYLSALLLGPIKLRGTRFPLGALLAGFTGSIGAMFGDVLLAYVHYVPATLIIKFVEGFLVGCLFARLKAGLTEEKLGNGKNTMRILLSGFLIAGAIIIIGVNSNPTATVLWIIIGSFFIITAFVSILRGKIPIYFMVLSMLAGGVIMVIGYFMYERFVLLYAFEGAFAYSSAYAYVNLPWNIIQALVGIIVAIPVYEAVQKAEILRNL